MLLKNDSNKDYKVIPKGLHHAVTWLVVDGGTHDSEYEGRVRPRHIVIIGWEIPSQTIEIEGEIKPMVISSTYTLTFGRKANLRIMLESMLGEKFTNRDLYVDGGFHLKKILGKNCQVNVIHNETEDKTWANIANSGTSVVPMSPGMPEMDLYNEPIYFSFEENTPLADNIPKWIKEKIWASREFNEGAGMQNQPSQREIVDEQMVNEVFDDSSAPTPKANSSGSRVSYGDRNPPLQSDDDIPF